jgi:hypothetical protein
MSADEVNEYEAPSRSWAGDVTRAGGAPADPSKVTQMLTVWRTLNVERTLLASSDTSADQARMDLSGNFSRLQASRVDDASAPFVNSSADRDRLNDSVVHDKAGDWVGGALRLQFHPSDEYLVTANGSTSVDVAIETGQANLLAGQTDGSIADRRYLLRDDSASSLDKAVSLDLAVATLRRAYIELRVQDVAPLPFRIERSLLTNTRHLQTPALVRLPARVPSSDEFWSVLLIRAFDGDPSKDLDPSTESSLQLGVAEAGILLGPSGEEVGNSHLRVAVFAETIIDLAQSAPGQFGMLASIETLWDRTVAHELLHTLSVPHDERSGLMCAGMMIRPGPAGNDLDPSALVLLRGLSRPTRSKSRLATCP